MYGLSSIIFRFTGIKGFSLAESLNEALGAVLGQNPQDLIVGVGLEPELFLVSYKPSPDTSLQDLGLMLNQEFKLRGFSFSTLRIGDSKTIDCEVIKGRPTRTNVGL